MEACAVDLFCGAGGLTYGLEEAGIRVAAGIDIDSDCKKPYEQNTDAEFIEANIAEIEAETVNDLFPDEGVTILAGCAPCQPFSPLNNGAESRDHEKWGLLKDFGRLVEEVEPVIVAMENVFEVRHHDVYREFVTTLESNGYSLSKNREVFCPDHGIPQSRKRWVLLASKHGYIELKEGDYPEDAYRTVADAIQGLPSISAGEADDEDPLHQAQGLSQTNVERIQQSEPGGTWEDWDEELLLDCHKKKSGRSYKSPYGRMEWDSTAPTITTQFFNYGSGRFGHPEEDRPVSLREGAMLQTFPQEYFFVNDPEELSRAKLGEMIGNAVPPKLSKEMGESILRHIQNEEPQERLHGIGTS